MLQLLAKVDASCIDNKKTLAELDSNNLAVHRYPTQQLTYQFTITM